MSGWVKLHRDIVNWEWYLDMPVRTIFIHLIMMANHVKNNWKGIEVQRGQHITSYETLSKQTGLTIKQVRRAIKKLLKSGEIRQTVGHEKGTRFLFVTITNYDNYQAEIKRQGSKRADGRARKGQQKGSKQEGEDELLRNSKNEKKEASLFALEIFEIIKNDVQYRDDVNEAIHLNGSFDSTLRKFINEMKAKNDLYERDVDDLKVHFINWAKNERQNNQQTATTTISFDEAQRKIDERFSFLKY